MLSDVSWNENSAVGSKFNQLSESSSIARKIILCNKGETGYLTQMDLDGDGILTLDEFNEYCTQNGISEEDKLKLLSIIQTTKNNEELTEDNNKEDNKGIYAKRGEEKYNEKMDENKDSKITYEEYIKYCKKQINNKEKEQSDNQTQSDEIPNEEQEAVISVEIEA